MGRISRFVRVWVVGRLLKRNPLWAVLLWLAARVRQSRRAATGIPFSPVRAGRYVGASFLRRAGYVDPAAPEPDGEFATLDVFARPSFDPDDVAPGVRRFYEHTADYRLQYRVSWGLGFRTGAKLAGRVTSRIEQLNLPGAGSGWRPLVSRFVAVSVPGDPREDVRGWVRENERGEAVFVALYGAHVAEPADSEGETKGEGEAERFVNIAVPLPGCNLSTVLRPRNEGIPDTGAIEWTTEGGGDPGLFLVTPIGPFRLPIGQRFAVRVAEGADPADPDAPLVGTHEMWLLGLTFLSIDYRIDARAERR